MTVPDVVVFPESIELGDPNVVVPPVVRDGMSVTEGRHRDRDLGCTGGQAGTDVCLEEQELPRDNNEAIVVGAVSSGFVPFDGTRGTGYNCCFSGTKL